MMQIDDTVFDVRVPGSSLETIAAFSQATEDPNPIHVDPEFARRCGFPQVIQQGPMTTAHFGCLLADRFGVGNLVWLDVSFVAPVFPQESLRLQAKVAGIEAATLQLELSAAKEDGTLTARGRAQVRVTP